jgi:predicted transcriptional regulator
MPSKDLSKINRFWETLKNKYGQSISSQRLIMELGMEFGNSPSTIKNYIWMLRNLGLIRQDSKFKYSIAPTGLEDVKEWKGLKKK